MELLKTAVNRDLSKGIPVLASVVRLVNLFFDDPMSGITRITDIIKNIETVRHLLITTNVEAQQIFHDLSDIANTLTRMLTAILSETRG
jgi:signal-transduction protein with cAMP-binding, CBS, and nucleotidyltransferase domain